MITLLCLEIILSTFCLIGGTQQAIRLGRKLQKQMVAIRGYQAMVCMSVLNLILGFSLLIAYALHYHKIKDELAIKVFYTKPIKKQAFSGLAWNPRTQRPYD